MFEGRSRIPERQPGSPARRATWRVAAAAIAGGMIAAGCGSASTGASAGGSATKGGPVTFGVSSPFTGSSDFIGPLFNAPVQIACKEINAAGGILGHRCNVIHIDSKSDPADAVENLHQALATHSGVDEVLGLGSSTGPALVPILAKSHIVAMSGAGESAMLHPAQVVGAKDAKYVYMLQPVDELTGFAYAFAAAREHLTRPALVFTTGPGTAPVVAGIKAALKALGLSPAITMLLAADQSDYGSEVHRVLSAHPDLIMTEMDPQTTGTFFQNLVTQTGGKLTLPFMSDDNSLNQPYYKAVAAAVGKSAFLKFGSLVSPVSSSSTTPGLKVLQKKYPAYHTGSPLTSAFTAPLYDGTILGALAMDATKSTSPSVFTKEIATIEAGSPGATTVYTYAQGIKALSKGKKIKYVGAAGSLGWNSEHVRFVSFEADRFGLQGGTLTQVPTSTVIKASTMEAKMHLK